MICFYKNLLLFSFLLLSFSLFGQKNIAGNWYGVITQNEGGYTSEYGFELTLSQKGDTLSGRSYVFVDDIYAEIMVKGRLHSGLLIQMEDVKISSSREFEGIEWCMKKYQLIFKRKDKTDTLEGHWQGKTSFSTCVPGKITLKKITPRA